MFVKNAKKSKLFKITWNGEKIIRKWFSDFLAPPKKIGGRTKNFFWKWKKSKLFKTAWNGEKISRKRVLDFLAPPPKFFWGGGVQKKIVENENNQSCSKLPEMARTLVENKIRTF